MYVTYYDFQIIFFNFFLKQLYKMQQLTQHIIVVVLICLIAYTVLFYDKHETYFFKKKIAKENFSEVLTNSDYDANVNDEYTRNLIKSNIVNEFVRRLRIRYTLQELFDDYSSKIESIVNLNEEYISMIERYRKFNDPDTNNCSNKDTSLTKLEYKSLLEECYDRDYLMTNEKLRNDFIEIEKILFDLFLNKILLVQNVMDDFLFNRVVNTYTINLENGKVKEGIPEELFNFKPMKNVDGSYNEQIISEMKQYIDIVLMKLNKVKLEKNIKKERINRDFNQFIINRQQ